jgi:endonuclease YncB( thermonuclease family)
VAGLAAASAYFAVGVERQRVQARQASAPLRTGDVVRLDRVIDGDTVIVKNDGGSVTTIRLLGIKAFEAMPERDPTARFGQGAVQAIQELAKDAPLRVMVDATAEDKHGRTLATLYAGDRDLGLVLVQRGLALVYTVYPFPAMPYYSQAQENARAAQLGIWGDGAARLRAEALAAEWRRRTE